MKFRMIWTAIVVTGFALVSACNSPASAASIAIVNHDFEDVTGIAGDWTDDNTHNLGGAGTYNGWSESLANFSPASVNNLGLINVADSDIPIETPDGDSIIGNNNGDEDESPDVSFPKVAVYHESNGRLNQTTGHLITGLETSFTMTVDVGRDLSGQYGGYNFSIYADDGSAKTILGTLDSNDLGATNPGVGSWAPKTLTISDDFSGFVGQLIGVSLYNSIGERVFYDNVTLSYEAVPEPSTAVLAGIGMVGLIATARRRRK